MVVNKPLFGVAGFPVNFFKSPYGKNRDNIFKWLNSLDLNILELQCTYGIRMKEEQAIRYRKLAEESKIILTIHAPYYINLGSLNDDVVNNSKKEIIKAIELAKLLGVKRIIFHPGGGYGKDRDTAIINIIRVLNEIKEEVDIKDIKLYPEIGGKINSLGSLDEIIRICKDVDYAMPCLDLAHLHARENGSLKNEEAIIDVFNKVERELSSFHLKNAHFHMYPVDYTDSGEKVHKAFGDKVTGQLNVFDDINEYMPIASHFVTAIKEKGLNPLVICEAKDTQEIGAMLMQDLYFNDK